MPYADFQCMIDDPPGFRNYWTAEYHDDFPDDALDVFVKYGFDRPSPITQQLLVPWGGAVARVADDATPMTKRDAAVDLASVRGVGQTPADDDANIAWARGFRRDIAQYASGGVYLNFIGDEGDGPGPGCVRRGQVPAARRDQGRVRPEERVPRQPEHQTGELTSDTVPDVPGVAS